MNEQLTEYFKKPGSKTQAEVAEDIDVDPSNLTAWKKGDRPIPPAKALGLEYSTNGEIKAEPEMPEIFSWFKKLGYAKQNPTPETGKQSNQ